MRKALLVLTLTILNFETNAQILTNKGKDFWVGFGHHQFMETATDNSMNMTLYLSVTDLPAGSSYATVTVTIDSSGFTPALWWTRTYHIAKNTVISIDNSATPAYSFSPAAALSWGPIPKGPTGAAASNTSTSFDARLYTDACPAGAGSMGVFRKKGIHITSDVDITAYSHIYGSVASGASMLLPTNTWGYSYTTINSKQGDAAGAFNFFYVLAKDDNTKVKITSSKAPRYKAGCTFVAPTAGVPFFVTLNKGQIYQYVGDADAAGNGVQLTGSHIESVENSLGQINKIAVFAGSSRTSGESDGGCSSSSRDNDMQQCFPENIWGKRYVTTPFATSSGSQISPNVFASSSYKIVCKDTGTLVKVNGGTAITIPMDSFYQFTNATPNYIESNKPIMVGQFMTSGNCGTGQGDPAVVYLTPLENGFKNASTYRTTKESITANFISLIVPDSGYDSLKIDNQRAPLFGGNSSVTQLPNYSGSPGLTGYKMVVKGWAATRSQSIITSTEKFIGITYGLGGAESYAYSLGFNYDSTANSLSLIAKNNTVCNSVNIVEVPITVKNFISLTNLKGSLVFDSTILKYNSISYFNPTIGINQNNINLFSSNKLTFSWLDSSLMGKSLNDSSILFTVKFNLLNGSLGKTTYIDFSNTPINLEATQVSTLPLNIITQSSTIKIANNVITNNINLVGCDTVMYNNKKYINTTFIRDTIKNEFLCDSVINNISITVNKASSSISNINICPNQLPFIWNGLTLNASGSQTKILVNSQGCDSLATLNLVVKTISSSITNTSICPNQLPFIWNGLNFSSSSTQTRILVNAQGCDSFATLNLTVKANTSSITNASICSKQLPYSWNGLTFTTAGSKTKILVNSQGCDSAATLNLIVKTNTSSITNTSICSNQLPFIWNGLTFSASGSQTKTLINSQGCDSLATLNLTVKTNTSSITNTSICSNQLPFIWNGLTFTASGSKTKTLVNSQGCDSLATLYLTVSPSAISKNFLFTGCPIVTYNGVDYFNSTIVKDTVKNTLGCDSVINIATINILNSSNCGGYLELISDSLINYFGDTLHVKIKIKNGVNIFSTYAYLNFDSAYLTYLESKVGDYLGNQIINQPPINTGDKIDFGLTKTSSQQGSNGDGTIYEFKFLLKQLPIGLPYLNTFPLLFSLSNLSIYNKLGSTPSSFNLMSVLNDTTLCKYYVPVWPGDLNNDKKVSVADLLPIGYFYGSTGSPRPSGNLSWTPQPAILWGFDISSKTSSAYKVFADGNADGVINLADQAAIGFNLSNSHARNASASVIGDAKIVSKTFPTNVPALKVQLPYNSIVSTSLPTTIPINITLGSASLPVNNLYGVAFEIYFNPAYINSSNITTNYTGSIFGTLNTNYTKIEDYSEIAQGKLSIALTRFNTTTINATGGQVLSINLPLLASIPFNNWVSVTVIPIACNDNIGTDLAVTGSADSLKITIPYFNISGKCVSQLLKPIKNSTLNLLNIATVTSNIDGVYLFDNNIIANSNYTIRPTKNNDVTKANGINATDVLFTQRHILNTTKLNSAYKLIAADVNGDKNINATDILRIKRLILGTDTTFTSATKGSRLWEFVDSAYQFPDTTNPFPFKDSISFTNLTSNKINQTFIGVKLGDVNYDWNPLVAKGSLINNVELIIDNADIKVDKQLSTVNYQLPIKVKNFKDLVAMQYTLHFDHTKYEFVGIENNHLNVDFNSKQATENGNITMLWTDKNAVERSLEDGTELFVLVLQSTVDRRPSTDLELALTNDITEVAAWDKELNQHNIILTKQQKLQTPNPEQWSVSPNPTSGDIKVNIVSKVNKAVSFELTDAQGKTILKQVVELQKGNNNFTMNLKKNGNLTTGIYFLKAVGVEGENVKKVLVR